jgi:hypothetical protein
MLATFAGCVTCCHLTQLTKRLLLEEDLQLQRKGACVRGLRQDLTDDHSTACRFSSFVALNLSSCQTIWPSCFLAIFWKIPDFSADNAHVMLLRHLTLPSLSVSLLQQLLCLIIDKIDP